MRMVSVGGNFGKLVGVVAMIKLISIEFSGMFSILTRYIVQK